MDAVPDALAIASGEQAEENRRQDRRDKELRDRQRERLKKAKMIEDAREVEEGGDYHPESSEEDEEATPLQKKKGAAKKKIAPIEVDPKDVPAMTKAFRIVEFTHSRYPDYKTANMLGIEDDVRSLLNACGLGTFVGMRRAAYPDLCAEFLASIRIRVLDDSVQMMEEKGGGYITFSINGKQETATFKEIQEHFGFPPGKTLPHKFDPKELDKLWELITGEPVFDSQCKGTRIRSPVVAYVRKAIAVTLFPRDKTGPCSSNDFKVFASGFRKTFPFHPITNEPIFGDINDASLAYILCLQLDSYRGKIAGLLKKGSAIARIACGGIITAILELKGVPFDPKGTRFEPLLMDISYLRLAQILAPASLSPKLLYKFPYPELGDVHIELPNPDITTFAKPGNIMFIPDEDLLFQAKKNTPATGKGKASRSAPSTSKGKGKSVAALAPTFACDDDVLEKMKMDIIADLIPRLGAEISTRLLPMVKDAVETVINNRDHADLVKRVTNLVELDITDKTREDMLNDMVPKLVPVLYEKLGPPLEKCVTERIGAVLDGVITTKVKNEIALMEVRVTAALKKRQDQLIRAADQVFARRPDVTLPIPPPKPMTNKTAMLTFMPLQKTAPASSSQNPVVPPSTDAATTSAPPQPSTSTGKPPAKRNLEDNEEPARPLMLKRAKKPKDASADPSKSSAPPSPKT